MPRRATAGRWIGQPLSAVTSPAGPGCHGVRGGCARFTRPRPGCGRTRRGRAPGGATAPRRGPWAAVCSVAVRRWSKNTWRSAGARCGTAVTGPRRGRDTHPVSAEGVVPVNVAGLHVRGLSCRHPLDQGMRAASSPRPAIPSTPRPHRARAAGGAAPAAPRAPCSPTAAARSPSPAPSRFHSHGFGQGRLRTGALAGQTQHGGGHSPCCRPVRPAHTVLKPVQTPNGRLISAQCR